MLQVSRIVKPYDTRQKEKKKYGGMWAATACKQKQKKKKPRERCYCCCRV